MSRISRDFRLFWLAGAANLIGSQASSLVMPLLVLAVGGSPIEAGLVGTLGALARFGTAPLAGVYADRYPRRTLMTVAALAASAAMTVVTVGVATDTITWPVLLGAAMVEGTAAGWYAAAGAGAIRRVLPPERPERAVAALRARSQGAELIGPGLGGVLYQVAPLAPFLFDAVSYLVSAGLVRAVRTDLGPDRSTTSGTRSTFGADLAAGVRFVRGQPFLRFVVLWAAGVNLLLGALYFHVVLAARLAGASAGSIGLILTISGAVGLAGALAAPWIVARISATRLVVGFSWLLVAVVVPLALVRSPWQYGLVLGAVALISPALSVVFQTRAIMVTPDGMQSRAATVLGTVGEGAGALAPLLAGVLIGAVTPAAIAVAFAAALALLAWYATSRRRHLTDAPTPDHEAGAGGTATADPVAATVRKDA